MKPANPNANTRLKTSSQTLFDTLAGWTLLRRSCGTLLQDTLVENICRTPTLVGLVRHSCGDTQYSNRLGNFCPFLASRLLPCVLSSLLASFPSFVSFPLFPLFPPSFPSCLPPCFLPLFPPCFLACLLPCCLAFVTSSALAWVQLPCLLFAAFLVLPCFEPYRKANKRRSKAWWWWWWWRWWRERMTPFTYTMTTMSFRCSMLAGNPVQTRLQVFDLFLAARATGRRTNRELPT